jgi:photosystem II stability/assembly factor-like uncharacterized protein
VASPTALPPGPTVAAARLLNATDGWALTSNGLFITTDGGATWLGKDGPWPQTTWGVFGADFADAQHGWVATPDSADPSSSVFDVWRTDDGARSWQKVVLSLGKDRFETFGAVEFSVLDANHLFVFVPGSMPDGYESDLFESTDGGRTWSADRVTSAGGVTGPFAFADSVHGVVAGGAPGNRLFVTADGGRSWRQVAISVPAGSSQDSAQLLQAPWFWDARTGALVLSYVDGAGSDEVGVLLTADAGASWSLAGSVPLPSGGNYAPAAFLTPADWIMMPDALTLTRTQDAGRTWRNSGAAGLPGKPESLFMANAEHGWALVPMSVCLGYKTDCSSRTGLYATVDGGLKWTGLWPK